MEKRAAWERCCNFPYPKVGVRCSILRHSCLREAMRASLSCTCLDRNTAVIAVAKVRAYAMVTVYCSPFAKEQSSPSIQWLAVCLKMIDPLPGAHYPMLVRSHSCLRAHRHYTLRSYSSPVEITPLLQRTLHSSAVPDFYVHLYYLMSLLLGLVAELDLLVRVCELV